jgi:hypothetical protein
MKYRSLNSYKYQVMGDCSVQTNICPLEGLIFRFMELSTTGELLIRQGYAWDGVTGLLSTPNKYLRGSLVHDALYQLMRLSALDQSSRILADQALEHLCLEDGALRIIAKCLYCIVRLTGSRYSTPEPMPEVIIYEI